LATFRISTAGFGIVFAASAVELLKVAKEQDVIVVFNENPKGNWFLAGEQL
jgi:phenylpyruvate tautomerase PptA (4-oxalocrotonate tautomerase family)